MFDALDEQMARDEGAGEHKNAMMRTIAIGVFVTLMVFAVLGWAMWRYTG